MHLRNPRLCALPHRHRLLHLHPVLRNALSGRLGHLTLSMRYTSHDRIHITQNALHSSDLPDSSLSVVRSRSDDLLRM